jgi:thiol:disulfide interchange protein DsbD
MIAAFAIGLLSMLAFGQQDEGPSLDISVIPSKAVYVPGDTVVIALRVGIPANYHLYGNPMGPGIGRPVTIGVSGAAGVAWLDIKKTKPKKYTPAVGEWVWAYDRQASFFLRGIAPAADGEVKGLAVFDGLICHTSCFPRHLELPFTFRISAAAPAAAHFAGDRKTASSFADATGKMDFEKDAAADATALLPGPTASLSGIALGATVAKSEKIPAWNYKSREARSGFNIFLAIFFAFLAGIILNAMPCVLPVLGIKVLSFAQGNQGSRKSAVIHSLAFSAGIISVFMLLAALAAFADYSWGKHFQDPKFLIGIIALIVVFALGMFDAYMIMVPSSLANLDGKHRDGMFGDFFKGIFATILATPCSGPFLGAVLAWTITQPPVVIFIVYASIGAGMSFPYVLLSASRRLSHQLPKPGKWMQDFKGLMGFLLLGFAVYLMFGLSSDLIVPTVLFCLSASFAVVIYGRFSPWGSSFLRKVVSIFLALCVAAGGLYGSFFIVYPSFSRVKAEGAELKSGVWQDFSADSLLAANAAGRPAIVDFTANWCMNCQYNTIMVLDKREVTDLIRKKNVLALKVDMTMPNIVQDSLLHSLGSRSIPFLALFPGDRPNEPVIMRDILTKGKVIRELNKLR